MMLCPRGYLSGGGTTDWREKTAGARFGVEMIGGRPGWCLRRWWTKKSVLDGNKIH